MNAENKATVNIKCLKTILTYNYNILYLIIKIQKINAYR